jgi:hypothetical protein
MRWWRVDGRMIGLDLSNGADLAPILPAAAIV